MKEILETLWNNGLFYPFLNFLLVIYHVVGDNLGIAVIILAVIIRLILIPFTKKQTDMTRKMAEIKPRLDELQKKHKNNQEALAKEQMKLYKETGYNPLGCITSLVPQMLVLIVIIQVIRVTTNNDFHGVYSFVKDFVNITKGFEINNNFAFWDLSKNYMQIAKETSYFDQKGIAYFLLSLLVGFVQYVSTKFMQIYQGPAPKPKDTSKSLKSKNGKVEDEPMSQEEMQLKMTQSMNSIFPIMSVVFTLSAPAVLGIYWFVQSIMTVVQYFILDYKKSIETTRAMIPKFLKKSN